MNLRLGTSEPGARLSRAEMVARNDLALMSAVSDLTLESGWDALTFSGIAKRAGLTVGALYGRAENTGELGIALWQDRIGPWLTESVSKLNDAGRSGHTVAMRRELLRWEREPEAALAVELLIASLFDIDLGEVVTPGALAALSPWCLPDGSAGVTPASEAAAGVLSTSFALGRAIAQRAGVPRPRLSTRDSEILVAHHRMSHTTVRDVRPKPLKWVSVPNEEDPQSHAVIRATLDVIGRVGYKRATIARIARASGVPRGSILRHVPDKAALVARAARLGLMTPREVWDQYSDVVDAHGPLRARAIFLEDFLQADNKPLWAVNLELARMSRFIPALRDFCPGSSVLEQTHLGVMLVGSLVPGIAGLPYNDPFSAGSTT